MTFADEVIALACSYAPMREIGHNDCLFNDVMHPRFGYSGSWCDAGVSTIALQKGALSAIGGPHLHTPTHYQKLLGMGLQVPVVAARAGDLAFFDWDFAAGAITQHIEFVIARRDGWLDTIGFNTSPGTGGSQFAGGGVFLRRRNPSTIRGVFRPKWPSRGTGLVRPWLGAGVQGPRVVTVQRALGVEPDGVFGAVTRAELRDWQTRRRVGLWGQDVQRAWRGKPSGVVDEATWVALTHRTPPPAATTTTSTSTSTSTTTRRPGGASPAAPRPTQTVILPWAAHARLRFTLRLQGFPLDGQPLQADTIRALQTVLGVTPDGVLSAPKSRTVTLMQRQVGIPTTGRWSADTTTAVNAFLGAGRSFRKEGTP